MNFITFLAQEIVRFKEFLDNVVGALKYFKNDKTLLKLRVCEEKSQILKINFAIKTSDNLKITRNTRKINGTTTKTVNNFA